MVDPLSDSTNMKKASKPVKLLSVDALKRALRYVTDSIDYISSATKSPFKDGTKLGIN